MATATREEIFDKVQSTLVDALGVDADEVTRESTLTGDLGSAIQKYREMADRAPESERANALGGWTTSSLPVPRGPCRSSCCNRPAGPCAG